jgi:hypothetical protein
LTIRATNPLAALNRHFGHAAFRPGQKEVVEAALAGSDLLAVMPTGFGKSIGFQLPAMLLPGVTLVVSPLVALMKDQVDELQRKGIAAAAIHSPPLRLSRAVREPAFLRSSGRAGHRALRRRRGTLRLGMGTRLPPRLPPARRGRGAVPPGGRLSRASAGPGLHGDRDA